MFRPSTKTKKVSVRSLTSKSDPFLLDVTDESKSYLLTQSFDELNLVFESSRVRRPEYGFQFADGY